MHIALLLLRSSLYFLVREALKWNLFSFQIFFCFPFFQKQEEEEERDFLYSLFLLITLWKQKNRWKSWVLNFNFFSWIIIIIIIGYGFLYYGWRIRWKNQLRGANIHFYIGKGINTNTVCVD